MYPTRQSFLSVAALFGLFALVASASCSSTAEGPQGSGGATGGASNGASGGARASGSGGADQPAGTGGISVPAGGTGGASATGGRTGTGGSAERTGGSTGSGGSVSSTGGSGPARDAGAGADATTPVADGGGATDVNQGGLPNITLHLAGDSTVMTYAQPTATADEGWGQELGQFFISKVTINNQSLGGQTSVSFHSGRWSNIMSAVRAGDYVMAAFGANDSSTANDRFVEPATFQSTFALMADEVKAKQATFIPVTPSALREFSGAREGNVRLGPYATATIAVGTMKGLPVDDLNARSVELLNMIGPTGAMLLYKGVDKAHFTKAGATQMAQIVAEELRRIGSPLAAYLK